MFKTHNDDPLRNNDNTKAFWIIVLSIFIAVVVGFLIENPRIIISFICLIVFLAFAIITILFLKDLVRFFKFISNIFNLNDLIEPETITGAQYERKVAIWMRQQGYSNVIVTPQSGDFGVDITAYKYGIKYAVQCKYYTGKVGVSAVHEVAGGMAHYGCDIGMVVTNSTFTDSARTLARENGIILKENVIL